LGKTNLPTSIAERVSLSVFDVFRSRQWFEYQLAAALFPIAESSIQLPRVCPANLGHAHALLVLSEQDSKGSSSDSIASTIASNFFRASSKGRLSVLAGLFGPAFLERLPPVETRANGSSSPARSLTLNPYFSWSDHSCAAWNGGEVSIRIRLAKAWAVDHDEVRINVKLLGWTATAICSSFYRWQTCPGTQAEQPGKPTIYLRRSSEEIGAIVEAMESEELPWNPARKVEQACAWQGLPGQTRGS